jgi:hypothetical protein
VCRIEPTTGLCLGCWRTLGEIADWAMLSSAEKTAVFARIKVRRLQEDRRQ